MTISIKDFCSKCDQICSFLGIWSNLLKKSLMEYFICCGINFFKDLIFQFFSQSFSGILQSDWDNIKVMLNNHRIRNSTNAECPWRRPDIRYFYSAAAGVTDYKFPEKEKLDEALRFCVYPSFFLINFYFYIHQIYKR